MPRAILFSGSITLLMELAVRGNDLEGNGIAPSREELLFSAHCGSQAGFTIAVTNRRVPDFRAVFGHRSGDPAVLLIALVFFSDLCTYLKGRT